MKRDKPACMGRAGARQVPWSIECALDDAALSIGLANAAADRTIARFDAGEDVDVFAFRERYDAIFCAYHLALGSLAAFVRRRGTEVDVLAHVRVLREMARALAGEAGQRAPEATH